MTSALAWGGRGLDRVGMGGTGAGDPGVGARRRRRAGRDCAGSGREQRASSSHGDLAAAVDQAAENSLSRAHSARPSHLGDHVDRGAAAAAAGPARGAHPIRERRGLGVYGCGAGGNVDWLLSRHLAAAALDRGSALPHAHILPDFDHAQLPPHVGLAGARVRARARAAAGRLADGTRSAVDRDRGGIARLRHPPPARGAQMSELHAYTLLVLVGFLPSEIWRVLGLVAARGIADESELFMWVRAVAIAVLAGVIAKIILVPPGTLASVPAVIRLAAIVCGFAAFVIVRRSVLAGVVAGEAVLTVGALAYGI